VEDGDEFVDDLLDGQLESAVVQREPDLGESAGEGVGA
jgi:hypothetical protein